MTSNDRFSRKTYWHEAGRHLKRSIVGRRPIDLFGRRYLVAYEARHYAGNDTRDLDIIRRLAADRRCIFDVGANMGITALLMSAAAPGASIHAFEASEATALIIRENLLLNGIEAVSIVNALLGSRSGVVTGFHWDYASGAASAAQAPPSGSSVLIDKVSLALDDYAEQRHADPDFVKVDVEGYEIPVLAGFQRTLKRVRPEVFVEVHAWPGAPLQQSVVQLLSLCHSADYRLVDLHSKEIIVDGGGFTDEAPSSLEAQARVLMMPTETATPSWLREHDTSRL